MFDFRYRRLRYIAVVTPDLARAAGFLKNMVGLADGGTSANPNVRFLRCSDEHHDIMLIKGSEPGLARIAFEMESSKDLEATRTHLEGLGLAPTDVSAAERAQLGIEQAFRIVEPTLGLAMEFMLGMESLDTPFEPTLAKIARLGHLVITTTDPKAVSTFMLEKLNFTLSDGNDWGGLMRPFPSPYHHSLGIVKGTANRLGHIAFMVEEIDDVGRGLARFKRHDVPVVFGPGRHPASDSIFLYFLDPDGLTWEYTFGMEEFPEVNPRGPRVIKPGPDSMDHWGNIMDPRMSQVGRVMSSSETTS